MARKDQDRKPVEVKSERTDRQKREVDLFKSMEEDMVFGGRGDRGVDLRSSSNSSDDDRGRW